MRICCGKWCYDVTLPRPSLIVHLRLFYVNTVVVEEEHGAIFFCKYADVLPLINQTIIICCSIKGEQMIYIYWPGSPEATLQEVCRRVAVV